MYVNSLQQIFVTFNCINENIRDNSEEAISEYLIKTIWFDDKVIAAVKGRSSVVCRSYRKSTTSREVLLAMKEVMYVL